MSKVFDPQKNYNETLSKIGYKTLKDANQEDYDRIGFMSGLEVHQQLLTKKKLFCNCPAGVFNKHDDYDAEIVRHMRPTLSELGEYDGTALMEFRTRKEITYRLKHASTCTYEIDDTPPFPMNREALEESIEISLLSKLNIVGEVHITRKQYLDGSIPAGFQRTAIIGVEGELEVKGKKIRLIQLSIEEDSCREISDIGHKRLYKTDRLGMPLIETVTYPDFVNPQEVQQGCDYIRFLNRSTGKVRTGIGAGRQDVNVSCRGGSRVEIKGVAHTKWIPELSHNEAYRQWALLSIRDILKERISNIAEWKISHKEMCADDFANNNNFDGIFENNHKVIAVRLPHFYKILSHFTLPSRVFANEISERLRVIACLDQPNMTHSEDLNPILTEQEIQSIFKKLKANKDDAFILFDAEEEDIKTALETIEERCKIAFEGVPEETRKSFADGNTIFERVLPGADRMYPDTDSAPISLSSEYIESLRNKLPSDISDRYKQLQNWGIAEDTFTYIFSKNLYPALVEIADKTNFDTKKIGNFLGHTLKNIEGSNNNVFDYNRIVDLFIFIESNKLEFNIAETILRELFKNHSITFETALSNINFADKQTEEIIKLIPTLIAKYEEIGRKQDSSSTHDWVMGRLRGTAIGNINFTELSNIVLQEISK